MHAHVHRRAFALTQASTGTRVRALHMAPVCVGARACVRRVRARRGAAARFDPKNPDGHYVLDLSQPWDHFLAETLYERMVNETGESWINHSLDAKQLELPQDSSTAWEASANADDRTSDTECAGRMLACAHALLCARARVACACCVR
eukprot:530334-Pleurochrysis_carterae.AAC.1